MYELNKNGNVFTSKFVGTGPSSYEKRIYRAAVSQRFRNTYLENGNFSASRHPRQKYTSIYVGQNIKQPPCKVSVLEMSPYFCKCKVTRRHLRDV